MKFKVLLFAVASIFTTTLVSCKKDNGDTKKQTILSGELTILSDESIFPIVEDQAKIFEHNYNASFKILSHPEAITLQQLIQDTARVAMLTRLLTPQEEQVFTSKNITPRLTRFGIDAIAFITNKNNPDSLIALEDVYHYLKGEHQLAKPLVFDNPNSSVTRMLYDKAGVTLTSNNKILAKSTSADLIKFIAENENYIGVIGINWLTQTPSDLTSFSQNIKILSVGNVKTKENSIQYIYPSQANIGKKLYPLTRELFLLNYQGTTGLGMGFASFVVSDIGQKIMLTSGLAPMEVQQLEINIKK